jgi:hypothetical protein
MDRDSTYRDIVKRVLSEAVRYIGSDQKDLHTETVFDDTQGHYQVGQVGWLGKKRIDHVYLHLDVINGKVWIQRDSTDLCIANDLERAGIPREHIVLGFKHPDIRPDTDYAVA